MSEAGILATTEGAILILLIAAFMHEPFRWLGLYVGRSIAADSPLFDWVKAVANAIVASLVMRLLLFPAGDLAAVPDAVRIGAFAAGILGYYLAGRVMSLGVLAAVVVLLAGTWAGG
ncbi:MAG: AzlD domain-containing protein [Hyphomicrobiaceae bacterium]|nr:AzlD domain-containing protein [Hyphomicrobiaceae bacterium]